VEWGGRGVFGFFSVFYSISHLPSLAATLQSLTVVAGRTDTPLAEKLIYRLAFQGRPTFRGVVCLGIGLVLGLSASR
jgi:hypothetical protein